MCSFRSLLSICTAIVLVATALSAQDLKKERAERDKKIAAVGKLIRTGKYDKATSALEAISKALEGLEKALKGTGIEESEYAWVEEYREIIEDAKVSISDLKQADEGTTGLLARLEQLRDDGPTFIEAVLEESKKADEDELKDLFAELKKGVSDIYMGIRRDRPAVARHRAEALEFLKDEGGFDEIREQIALKCDDLKEKLDEAFEDTLQEPSIQTAYAGESSRIFRALADKGHAEAQRTAHAFATERLRNKFDSKLRGKIADAVKSGNSRVLFGLPRELQQMERILNKAQREARRLEVDADRVGWISTYREQIPLAVDAVKELANGLVAADNYMNQMHDLMDDLPGRVVDVVNDVCGEPETKIRGAFKGLKQRTITFMRMHTQAKKRAEKQFETARDYKGFGGFLSVDRQIDILAGRRGNELQDELDRSIKNKALRAIMQWDDSALLQLCIRGDKKAALQNARTFKPAALNLLGYVVEDDYPRIPKESGWMDVHAHGDADNICSGDGKPIDVDFKSLIEKFRKKIGAEDLAHWKTAHKDLGIGIRLLSCGTGGKGKKPNHNIAQRLANALGVPVKAPTHTLWTMVVGGRTHLVIHDCGEDDQLEKRRNQDALVHHIMTTRKRGKWRTFKPNGEAAQRYKEYLLGLAQKRRWWQVVVTRVKRAPRKPDDLVRRLRRLNSRLSEREIRSKLGNVGRRIEWPLILNLTKKRAIDFSFALSRFNLDAMVEIMPRYKRYINAAR